MIDSNTSHDHIAFINNVSKEFYDIKKEIKDSNDKQKFKSCYLIVWSEEKIPKVKI